MEWHQPEALSFPWSPIKKIVRLDYAYVSVGHGVTFSVYETVSFVAYIKVAPHAGSK
jgi:hypothetical protein